MLPRTPLIRWLIVAFFTLVLFYYHPSLTGASIPGFYSTPRSFRNGKSMLYVKRLLEEHGIGPRIEYAARTIRYIPDAKERLSITRVDENLFPQAFSNITLDKKTVLPAGKVIKLHVTSSARLDEVDASSLIFGASTTFDRFTNNNTSPVKEWSRWLTNGNGRSNGAGLVLALFDAPKEKIEYASQILAIAGINATVLPSKSSLDMAGRYVDLMQMLYNHPSRNARKYFALIDDDTFFPCVKELLRTLSQYDPEKPYYIGTFTERMDWMMRNQVPMAYGGGGIFFTPPAVKEIVQLPCLDKNEEGGYIVGGDQGDRLLYNCLRRYTDITLTYQPLLRQEDQFGDPSGFYESGIQHLSLHHYKSWHHFEPVPMHTVADACGEDCVLQRFQFKDDYILANGYSVQHYPKGIDFDPLLMEGTFGVGDDDDPKTQEVVFSYSFGHFRKNLTGSGLKRSWLLLGARSDGNGRVQQVYWKNKMDTRWLGEGEQNPELDSIVVLTWIL